MEKLTLEHIKEESIDYNQLHNECLINIKEEIKEPPIAISIGYNYNAEPIPLVTYGNFCCLVGASKSMKSFFKTALLSCYIGGLAQTYFSNIKGHNIKGKYIIDIDTEQGKYHVQKAAKRVVKMVGSDYAGYKCFALRPKTPKERIEFIEGLFTDERYKGKIGLLSIDGVADLLENVNDLDRSNEITQKLMTWSSDNNCAIITVLHRNYESDKPTGHLGSAILKKSESVIFVNKHDNIVEVMPRYTRNEPFEKLEFWLEDGLPKENKTIF